MWRHECVALYSQLCVAMPGTAATALDGAMYYHDAGFRVFKGTGRCDVVGAMSWVRWFVSLILNIVTPRTAATTFGYVRVT